MKKINKNCAKSRKFLSRLVAVCLGAEMVTLLKNSDATREMFGVIANLSRPAKGNYT